MLAAIRGTPRNSPQLVFLKAKDDSYLPQAGKKPKAKDKDDDDNSSADSLERSQRWALSTNIPPCLSCLHLEGCYYCEGCLCCVLNAPMLRF